MKNVDFLGGHYEIFTTIWNNPCGVISRRIAELCDSVIDSCKYIRACTDVFVCLCMKWIKLEDVKETAVFLIEIMPLMFIPAAVGLITSWDIIRPKLLAYAAITVISTLLVMLVSGYVTDWMLKGEKKGEDK